MTIDAMGRGFGSPVLAVILAAAALFSFSNPVYACECFSDRTEIEIRPDVFLAHVLEVHEEQRWPRTSFYTLRFAVPVVWKGQVDPVIWATTFEYFAGNCGGGPIDVGDEYVLAMSTTPRPPNRLPDFSMCNMVRREPAEQLLGAGLFAGHVCPRSAGRIPAPIQARAQRHPYEFSGWGKRSGVPFYTWGTWLSLENPNLGYHPMFNSAVWRTGCG